MPQKTTKIEPEPPPPRGIVWSGRLTRDYKRERKGQHRATLDADLRVVLDALEHDAKKSARILDDIMLYLTS